MAFSGNFMCTSFKKELMTATHNFTNSSGNTFRLALYDNNASFNAATTAYTSSNEVCVVVLDFGSNKSSTSGDFQIVFPTADASNAIIRIA
mgnify:CR=1 FL=1